MRMIRFLMGEDTFLHGLQVMADPRTCIYDDVGTICSCLSTGVLVMRSCILDFRSM